MARLELYNREFEQLHETLVKALPIIPEERLYWKTFKYETFLKVRSIGELIIQIGQIQAYQLNVLISYFLDHPHELTTQDALPSAEQIQMYLSEVAEMRKRAFSALKDEDLSKRVYLPDRSSVTIEDLFLRALIHMSHHRGQ